MISDRQITLYHSPNTRSTGVLTLLEELGADYRLHVLLGNRVSAADVLWGTALTWTTGFKLVPLVPVIRAYIERMNARPAVTRAKAKDAEILAGGG